MAGFRSPLDAYRQDLARAQGRNRLASDDEYWIILATGLRRLAQAPQRDRPDAARRLSEVLINFAEEIEKTRQVSGDAPTHDEPPTGRPPAVADALRRFPEADFATTLVTEVRGAVADAEEAGALLLAREMLTDLVTLAAHAPPLDRGYVFLQLGRIARTLGDLDAAHDLYHAAGALGRTTGTQELVVREALSQAILARTRGNHPSARELFQAAADGAAALGLIDVSGLANHGLMIEMAEAGDFDLALAYGWQALSAARAQQAREAEMLINLAQLCADAGYDAAALGGFVAALSRASAPRLRLPALGGTVTSASRLRDRDRVAAAERAIAAAENDAFPFESARAWLSVARARRLLGDAAMADAAAERAAAIARAHGFHEITHHATERPAAEPASLSHRSLDVIRSLETWSDDSSLDAVLSSAPTD